jgi:hypothetical protein
MSSYYPVISNQSTSKILLQNQDDDDYTEGSGMLPVDCIRTETTDFRTSDSESEDCYYPHGLIDYNDMDDSTNSGRLSSRYTLQKKNDNGHHIIDGGKKNDKKQTHEFYETFIYTRTTIRNAITGEKYNGFYTGTLDENLFFKVIDATAPVKNKEPYILFYETPEQYERHTNQIVSKETKEKWNTKYLEAVKNYKKRQFHKHSKQRQHVAVMHPTN